MWPYRLGMRIIDAGVLGAYECTSDALRKRRELEWDMEVPVTEYKDDLDVEIRTWLWYVTL